MKISVQRLSVVVVLDYSTLNKRNTETSHGAGDREKQGNSGVERKQKQFLQVNIDRVR